MFQENVFAHSIFKMNFILFRSPFHERFFHSNSNKMKILFCSLPNCSKVITMVFCTWHDSCALMACAKFCSDMIPYNGGTLKPIFSQIWMTIEKAFMTWAPGPNFWDKACSRHFNLSHYKIFQHTFINLCKNIIAMIGQPVTRITYIFA